MLLPIIVPIIGVLGFARAVEREKTRKACARAIEDGVTITTVEENIREVLHTRLKNKEREG